jgi:hypothetical protein
VQQCVVVEDRAIQMHAASQRIEEIFWKGKLDMFKPPFASFGRRGQAATSAPSEPRAFAPDPLSSPSPPVAPLVTVEAQETPLHQSKKSNVNDT